MTHAQDANPTKADLGLLPGGVGRSTFALGAVPPYAARGESYRLLLTDGRALIDLNNNFTALVHGHAHPRIVAAAVEAVAGGASFGLPNVEELGHARALLDRLPGLDQVRYANSGTEAVMAALRVARAHTGRSGCVFVNGAYHGTSEQALVPGGERALRGVPPKVVDDVLVVPVNDVEALVAAVSAEPEAYAALILDPMPNRAGLIPLEPEFVDACRYLREQYGVLLIADEVISLRQSWSGASSAYGMEPDLMVVGKLIGGGHPVGAVAGRAEVMAELDPFGPAGLEHGGTFSANPVSMAAGRVALELLDPDAIAAMNDLGDRARQALTASLSAEEWEVRGRGSLFRLHPRGPAELARERQLALWWAACERGVLLIPNGLAAISTPMTAAVIDDALERLVEAVRSIS